VATKRRSNRTPTATPPGKPLSRKRAEYYLANYPPEKAELYFALQIPDGIPDIDDEIRTATEIGDRLQMEPEKSGPAFDALRALGLGALWITDEWETDPEALDADGFRTLQNLRENIRRSVRRHVGHWHKASRTALTPRARAEAADQLKQLGEILAGSRQGKHGPLASPFTVRRLYAEQLFRLLQFVRDLTAIDRRRITEAEVLQLRDNYRVAPEIIRDNYRFNEDGILGGRLSARHALSAVRDYVAAEFRLKPATVSTIISRGSTKVLQK
jgi:hypothetical protein